MVASKTLSHNELRSDLTRHGPCFTSPQNAALNPHPGVNTVSALRVRPDNSLARLSGFAVLSLLGTLVSAAPATAQGCAATACRATNVLHATAGTPLPLHYRAQFDQAADAPGSYTLVVKLTLVGA